ncbi:MAG TPA: hypothetical protein VEV82_09590 [Actinomycetota bacterium]|nr:hypothetical protein [Actinomycetota bacterium]
MARWRAEIGPDADAREAFSLGPLYGRLKERSIDLMGPPVKPAACRSAGTRDGKGIVFVSHSGIVHPAGFFDHASLEMLDEVGSKLTAFLRGAANLL